MFLIVFPLIAWLVPTIAAGGALAATAAAPKKKTKKTGGDDDTGGGGTGGDETGEDTGGGGTGATPNTYIGNFTFVKGAGGGRGGSKDRIQLTGSDFPASDFSNSWDKKKREIILTFDNGQIVKANVPMFQYSEAENKVRYMYTDIILPNGNGKGTAILTENKDYVPGGAATPDTRDQLKEKVRSEIQNIIAAYGNSFEDKFLRNYSGDAYRTSKQIVLNRAMAKVGAQNFEIKEFEFSGLGEKTLNWLQTSAALTNYATGKGTQNIFVPEYIKLD